MAEWLVVLLLEPGVLTRPRLAEAVTVGRGSGFDVWGPLWDAINVVGGDGLSSLAFESEEAALTWLGGNNGLLPLWHRRLDFELDMSIGRATPTLLTEESTTAEPPLFDECSLSLMMSAFDRRERVRIWRAVEGFAVALSRALGATFAFMLSEEAGDALFPGGWQIHSRLAAGRLPNFVPWLAMAPTGSPVATEMLQAASAVGGRVKQAAGWTRLRLSRFPWQTTTEKILRATAKWAQATRQQG